MKIWFSFVLLYTSSLAKVHGQCPGVLEKARQLATYSQCGCTAEPVCDQCVNTGGGSRPITQARCTHGCVLCDKTKSICGTQTYSATRGSQEIFIGDRLVPVVILQNQYLWQYTKGLSGNLVYTWNSESVCSVTINNLKCASCTMYKCTDTGLLEPLIDCSNLEAGATTTPCAGRTFGGFTSLDESALSGVLVPLAIPFQGCVGGSHVLAIDPAPTSSTGTRAPRATFTPSTAPPFVAPVAIAPPVVAVAPVSISSPTATAPFAAPVVPKAPAAVSPTTTVGAPAKCGLLRLGIFCLKGCGLLRSILGLCKGE
jgi:hypothetical protein